MIFVVRTGGPEELEGVDVLVTRPTPSYAEPGGGMDAFCDGDQRSADKLQQRGYRVITLKDGWYKAGSGGVAIWGSGKYWELRDTPFTVSRSSAS